MTRDLTAALMLFLVACSGGKDDEANDDTGATDEDTDTTDTDVIEPIDSGIGDDDDDDDDDDGSTVSETFATTVSCDASHTLANLVMNTAATTLYIDLDTGTEVGMNDGWDFSINEWVVELNSGVTFAKADGLYDDFDDICQAPPADWFTSDVTEIAQWYIYDTSDHTLTPQDKMYFVHTTDGAYVRLRWDGYYEDGGAVHSPGITFGPVADPAP